MYQCRRERGLGCTQWWYAATATTSDCITRSNLAHPYFSTHPVKPITLRPINFHRRCFIYIYGGIFFTRNMSIIFIGHPCLIPLWTGIGQSSIHRSLQQTNRLKSFFLIYWKKSKSPKSSSWSRQVNPHTIDKITSSLSIYLSHSNVFHFLQVIRRPYT